MILAASAELDLRRWWHSSTALPQVPFQPLGKICSLSGNSLFGIGICSGSSYCVVMDPNMKHLQEALVDIETDAEQLLLARHQLVDNDKMRNANREALTALRKRARTTKTSVPSPFDVIMKEIEGTSGKQLVKEICPTCGDHDPKEHTWLMFPGSDIFARVPFHVTHTILDKEQERLDYDTKKLQSFVKEKSFLISEKGALADKISPGIVKSLVSLTDKPK